MDLTVVLPVYERADAVLCALAGLAGQTLTYPRSWEVVIVDDSPDALLESEVTPRLPHFYETSHASSIRFIRSSPPRVGSFTAGRARNMGVANACGDLIVFIDQDVILAPDALEHHAAAYARHGDRVIVVGLYDWMRHIKFTPEDVRDRFHEVVACGLGHTYAFEVLPTPEEGILGLDMRRPDFGDIDNVVDDAALGCFGGNIGYPRSLYLETGGFDENIRGHGGEDADLGLTAKGIGAKFLLWDAIWGVHRWHPRDQKKNAREVQANIEYIDRKHGIGKYRDAAKFGGMDAQDWRDWRHYQKDVGGVLMKETGDGTVFVCRDGHRLGLPSPDWIRRLGFTTPNVIEVTQGGLSSYIVEGVAGHE